MKRIFRSFVLAFFGLAMLPPVKAQERYQATRESLKKYNTPDWFRDAKFGIFIHWGVYSMPAFGSEWVSA